jgi:hypothetical protein
MYKIKQKSDRARCWFGRIENRYLSCGSQRDIAMRASDIGSDEDGVRPHFFFFVALPPLSAPQIAAATIARNFHVMLFLP